VVAQDRLHRLKLVPQEPARRRVGGEGVDGAEDIGNATKFTRRRGDGVARKKWKLEMRAEDLKECYGKTCM